MPDFKDEIRILFEKTEQPVDTDICKSVLCNIICIIILLPFFVFFFAISIASFLKLLFEFFCGPYVSDRYVSGWATIGLGVLSAATVASIRIWEKICQCGHKVWKR